MTAGGLAGGRMSPRQETVLGGLGGPDAQPAARWATAQLAMFTGLFNLR